MSGLKYPSLFRNELPCVLNTVSKLVFLMTDTDEKKAGAKAVVIKVDNAYWDLKTEYQKEKMKGKLD